MKNPYDVLDVPESISDEDLNKVYKKLARKYHPDINPSQEAAQKMVEINCAYDEIKKMREQGKSFAEYNQQFTYPDSAGYQDAYRSEAYQNNIYMHIEQAIQYGLYFQAITLLQLVANRDGKWYYYYAVIYAKMGSINASMQCIRQALLLEPGNLEFQKFKESLQNAQVYEPGRQKRRDSFFSTFCKISFFIILLMILFSCLMRG